MTRESMAPVLWVGIGGFLGSVARFAAGGAVHRVLPASFPYGTLMVNATGCLLIGFLGGALDTRGLLGPGPRAFLLVGLLGGFTTYSSFAYETLALLHASEYARAAGNIVAHLALGLGAVWLGHALGRAV